MDPRSLLQDAGPSSSTLAPARAYTMSANGIGQVRKMKRIPRYLEGFVSEQEQQLNDDADAHQRGRRGSSNDSEGGLDDSNVRGNGKRAKVARACLFCKRSHMSCEDQRPCSRCIARGIGDRCCDTEPDVAAAAAAAATAASNVPATPNSPRDDPNARRPSYYSGSGQMHTSMSGQHSGDSSSLQSSHHMTRMSPPSAPSYSSSDMSPRHHAYQSHHHHHHVAPPQQPSPGPSFDAMLAFLGTMDAATAAWGPVPADGGEHALPALSATHYNDEHVAWSSLTHMTDEQPNTNSRIMTPAAAYQREPVHQQGLRIASPRGGDDAAATAPPPRAPAGVQPRSSSSSSHHRVPLAPRIDDSTLTESSKPFISGQLAEFDEGRIENDDTPSSPTSSSSSYNRQRQRNRPWTHVLAPDFTASYSLEESIVRPYQYAYGYTRIERWIRSPLSGWSVASADRAQAVLDQIRPLFRNRWGRLSDLQLVQHEERYETIVEQYRKHVCEAVPVPLVVIRRTCEIVCANTAFARLCNTDKSVFESGRLCLYQLMEQACMVAIFERLADLFLRNVIAPFHLDGQIRFSCASTQNTAGVGSSNTGGAGSGNDDGREHVVTAPSSSPAATASLRSNAAAVQLRHVRAPVMLSMEPIMDEYGLPLCLVCTLTPLAQTASAAAAATTAMHDDADGNERAGDTTSTTTVL